MNADWEADDGNAQILNKPVIGSMAAQQADQVAITGGTMDQVTQDALYISGTYYGRTCQITGYNVTEPDVFQLPPLSYEGGEGNGQSADLLARNIATNEVMGTTDECSMTLGTLTLGQSVLLMRGWGGGTAMLIAPVTTANRQWTLPDLSGTVVISDLDTFRFDYINRRLGVSGSGQASAPQHTLHVTGGNVRIDHTGASAGMIANRTDGAAVSLSGAANATLRFDDTKTLIIQSQPKSDILSGSSAGLNTMVTFSHALFAVELAEGFHVRTGTGTGSRIATATNQKIGFWGASPSVQPTAVANATDAASAVTQLNALLARLRTIGLIANS